MSGGAFWLERRRGERVVALTGSPNVGKSTLFNALTGLRQHTGNWPGKTVAGATGRHIRHGQDYLLADLPGTYSLLAKSPEETAARDLLCFGGADAAVVVCDAAALERSLGLVLQVLEVQPRTVVCINLMDEARKNGVQVDLTGLSKRLGVPVVGTSAGRKEGLEPLMAAVEAVIEDRVELDPASADYPPAVEAAAALVAPAVRGCGLPEKWLALALLEGEAGLMDSLKAALGRDLRTEPPVARALAEAGRLLEKAGLTGPAFQEAVAAAQIRRGAELASETVTGSGWTGSSPAVSPASPPCWRCWPWCSGSPSPGRRCPRRCCRRSSSGGRTGSPISSPGSTPPSGSTGPWCWGPTAPWPG